LRCKISSVQCDGFLTRALTRFEGLPYKTATERGGAGAQRPGRLSVSHKLLTLKSEASADICRLRICFRGKVAGCLGIDAWQILFFREVR